MPVSKVYKISLRNLSREDCNLKIAKNIQNVWLKALTVIGWGIDGLAIM